MKKISLLALILAASTVVFAQSPKFGLKAGVNISDIDWKVPNTNFDNRIGFHVGLLAHLHLIASMGFTARGAIFHRRSETKRN